MTDDLTEAKRYTAQYDEAEFYAQRLAGALIHTVCPNCTLTVGAMVINNDEPWIEVGCPACDHRWTEETA